MIKRRPQPRMMPVPEDWKVKRKPRRLDGNRLRKDYPCEIVINLSRKQMAYADWCAAQLYFNSEHFAYMAVVKAIQGWWGAMPDEVKKRITEMHD